MLVVVTVWSQWSTMMSLLGDWRTDDDYSAGQLVPFVVLFLVWRERKNLSQCVLAPCWWAGAAVLILAQLLRAYGHLSWRLSLCRYALVLNIMGLILLVAGRQLFGRMAWILLFLLLMVPLPEFLHSRISPPLQRMATTGSVFLLEAFGNQVDQQGNVVMLGDNVPMAVAEACGGLRMLSAFVIVAAFIAYMVKRPRWQKGIVLASSIPIAVICNIIRISLTAVIMLYVSVELGEKFFHDFAGLVMMPAAVSLIFGEIWLMDRLVLSDAQGEAAREGDAAGAGRGPGGVVVRRRARTP